MGLTNTLCLSQQYWVGKEPYRHISVSEIAASFKNWKIGKQNAEMLSKPFPKESSHPAALVKSEYALGSKPLTFSAKSLKGGLTLC